MINFTSSLNRSEEQHGVRATALSPGFVATPWQYQKIGWMPSVRNFSFSILSPKMSSLAR